MNQEKIGKFIKDIRKNNNLTQDEFANLFGVTYQAVSKWENGKNIPDIAILNQISEKFNVDITEILNGEKSNKKNKQTKKFIIIISVIIVISIVSIGLVLFFKNDNFEFKKISTKCENFNITGSMAYNKDKTSIFISNVNYCGEKNETVYEEVTCNLYENFENTNTLVSKCENENNKTLDEYLKDINISVNNYNSMCKKIDSSSFYLEISAKDKDGKVTSYKVPIDLNEC